MAISKRHIEWAYAVAKVPLWNKNERMAFRILWHRITISRSRAFSATERNVLKELYCKYVEPPVKADRL